MGSKYVRGSSQHFTPYVAYHKTPEECAQEGIAYKGYDDNLSVQERDFPTFNEESYEDELLVNKNDNMKGNFVDIEDLWYDFKDTLEDDDNPVVLNMDLDDYDCFSKENPKGYSREIYSAHQEFKVGSLLDLKADKFIKAKPNLVVFEATFVKADPLAGDKRTVRIFKTNSKLTTGSHYVTVDSISIAKGLTKDGRVKVYITVSTF